MTRAFAAVLALASLLALPVAASGHGAENREAFALTSFGWESTALGGLTARAALAEPQPLTGVGRNMRLVANIPIEGSTAGTDIELHGDHAYVGSPAVGLTVIDIKDPRNPKEVGSFKCAGGQSDIQLSPDGRIGVLSIETPSARSCHPNDEGFVVLDLSDPAAPRELAWVGQDKLVDGVHNLTMDYPNVYVNQYTQTYNKFEIFSIANPSAPRSIGQLDAGGSGSHDLQVDHRPDGKVYAYSSSIAFTDVLDVSDPTRPRFVQRFRAADHGVGIAHGFEPNHDRSLALEADEYAGGQGNGGCGGADGGGGTGPLPAGAVNSASPGALHILKLETSGARAGQVKTVDPLGLVPDQFGAFNIPAQANDGPDEGCTAHVFWQAPDENRLAIAWYGRGTRIVDFSDPARPVELGSYVPTGANTWSAKAHKGFIFTGDINRGFDVLQYTGEACDRWPTTSGAAEVQRVRYQGASGAKVAAGVPRTVPGDCGPGGATNDPVLPLSATPGQAVNGGSQTPPGGAGAPSSPGGRSTLVGGYRFARAVRAPRGRRTLTLEVRSTSGKRLTALRYRVRAGRRAVLRASIGGPVGRYAFRVTAGRKVLKRGSFTVKASSRTRVKGASASKVRAVRRAR